MSYHACTALRTLPKVWENATSGSTGVFGAFVVVGALGFWVVGGFVVVVVASTVVVGSTVVVIASSVVEVETA